MIPGVLDAMKAAMGDLHEGVTEIRAISAMTLAVNPNIDLDVREHIESQDEIITSLDTTLRLVFDHYLQAQAQLDQFHNAVAKYIP